jgi:hypothetical protein
VKKAILTGALFVAAPATDPASGAAKRLKGLSDSNAGNAMHAPSPRRNRRRLKFAILIVWSEFWADACFFIMLVNYISRLIILTVMLQCRLQNLLNYHVQKLNI